MNDRPKAGLAVPDTFAKFFRHPDYTECIPSCTACWLDLPLRLVP